MIDDWELMFCDKCNQMTNHSPFKLTPSTHWECLKCEQNRGKEE